MMADLLDLTVGIVTAHVARNKVEGERLPTLIRSIYKALANVGVPEDSGRKADPVVPIEHSIFDDHVVCLACGKRFRTLTRHLKTDHRLTAAAYRERFCLPRDHPVAAPEFTATRSRIARSVGLGKAVHRRWKRA